MKYFKFLILFFAGGLLLVACRQLGSSSAGSFIPGTYVNYAEGEFGVAYDTLLIQPMDDQGLAYRIYRNTTFRVIENGKLLEPQYKREQWTAAYDQKTRTMLEAKKGKLISTYPDAGMLVVGSREYRKVVKN